MSRVSHGLRYEIDAVVVDLNYVHLMFQRILRSAEG